MTKTWYLYSVPSGSYSQRSVVQDEKPEPLRGGLRSRPNEITHDWTDVPLPEAKEIPDGVHAIRSATLNLETQTWTQDYDTHQRYGEVLVYWKHPRGTYHIARPNGFLSAELPEAVDYWFYPPLPLLNRWTYRQFANIIESYHSVKHLMAKSSPILANFNRDTLEHLRIANSPEAKDQNRQALLNIHNTRHAEDRKLTDSGIDTHINPIKREFGVIGETLGGLDEQCHVGFEKHDELTQAKGNKAATEYSRLLNEWMDILDPKRDADGNKISTENTDLVRAIVNVLNRELTGIVTPLILDSRHLDDVMAIYNMIRNPSGAGGDLDENLLPPIAR